MTITKTTKNYQEINVDMAK